MLGGAYLSVGASLFVMLGGGAAEAFAAAPLAHKLLSAAIFPAGLSMIVLSGTDLLTCDTGRLRPPLSPVLAG